MQSRVRFTLAVAVLALIVGGCCGQRSDPANPSQTSGCRKDPTRPEKSLGIEWYEGDEEPGFNLGPIH